MRRGASGLAVWLVACIPNTAGVDMAETRGEELAVHASATRVADLPGRVQVHLVISNPASRPLSVQLSRYCPVRLRAHAGGVVVWDETKERACPFVARVLELAPGESETILHALDVRELLGRGVLRPGRYSISAHVPWDVTVRILDAGEFEVPA